MSGSLWSLAGNTLSDLSPDQLAQLADPGTFKAVCIDTPYNAPPGVHLGLYRYIATSATGCATLSPANSSVVGFSTVRPDRFRNDFDLTGRLMAQTDGAGVQLAYLYYGSLPTAQLGTPSPLNLGPLAAVYEPRSCPATPAADPVAQTVSGLTGCRNFTFKYATAAPAVGNVPTGGLMGVTDPAGRITSYGYSDANNDAASHNADNSLTRRLTKVTNPDGSTETYAYSGVRPAAGTSPTLACGASATGQLCSTTDPRAKTTSVQYAAATLALPRVSQITDRRGTVTSFAYTSSSMTSTDNAGQTPTEIRKFLSIDASGRVGQVQDLTGSTVLRDTTYSWDTPGATCRQPDAAVDNLLCSMTRLKLAGDANPSATTDVLYNNEGYPLVMTQRDPDNAASTFTTTDGYHLQYVNAAGSVTHYDDTPTGGSNVTSSSSSGKRIDPAGQPVTAFSIVDHTSRLTPRGNAASLVAGNAYRLYLTTWAVDAPTTGDGGGYNVAFTGNVCTGTGHNTGVICEQRAPASDSAPVSCTETFGSSRLCLDPVYVRPVGCPSDHGHPEGDQVRIERCLFLQLRTGHGQRSVRHDTRRRLVDRRHRPGRKLRRLRL